MELGRKNVLHFPWERVSRSHSRFATVRLKTTTLSEKAKIKKISSQNLDFSLFL